MIYGSRQPSRKKAERRMVSGPGGVNQRPLPSPKIWYSQFLIYRCSPSVCYLKSLFPLILQSMQYFSVWAESTKSRLLPFSLQWISGDETSPELGLTSSCLASPSALLSLDHFLPCWAPPFFLPLSQSSMSPWITVCIRHLTEG